MAENVSSLACCAAVIFSNISPQALFFNLAIFFNGLLPFASFFVGEDSDDSGLSLGFLIANSIYGLS